MALTASFSGTTGYSVAIGLGVGLNDVTGTVGATVSDADIDSVGSVTIEAQNNASIHAIGMAAAVAIAGGGTGGYAVAGGGAGAYNVVDVDVTASATDSTIDQTSGAGFVKVAASSASIILAEIVAASLAVVLGGTTGAGFALGASVAVNRIGNWTGTGATDGSHPSGAGTLAAGGASKVSAFLSDTSVNAAGTLSVNASSAGSIDAKILAIAATIAVGGTTGAGLSGAGAYALNFIGTSTEAYADNSGASTKDVIAKAVEVKATTDHRYRRACRGGQSRRFGWRHQRRCRSHRHFDGRRTQSAAMSRPMCRACAKSAPAPAIW